VVAIPAEDREESQSESHKILCDLVSWLWRKKYPQELLLTVDISQRRDSFIQTVGRRHPEGMEPEAFSSMLISFSEKV